MTRSGINEMVLLSLVADAAKHRREADELYTLALKKAQKAGLTNTAIAKSAGVSETAIRMYLKRHT